VTVTGAGRQRHSRISAATAQVIRRLWDGLPAADLAIAGRMLVILTERANAELARQPHDRSGTIPG
jgi:hypothetical protein